MKKPVIAIPIGDPAGVGPEIVAKSIASDEVFQIAVCVIVGDRKIVEKAIEITGENLKINEIKEPEAISADPMETDKFTFVLAAATPEVNAQVVRECRKKNIPVNNASNRDQCDFYSPGIAKDGDTVVGITSGGRDHKLAAKISQAVRNVLHV